MLLELRIGLWMQQLHMQFLTLFSTYASTPTLESLCQYEWCYLAALFFGGATIFMKLDSLCVNLIERTGSDFVSLTALYYLQSKVLDTVCLGGAPEGSGDT